MFSPDDKIFEVDAIVITTIGDNKIKEKYEKTDCAKMVFDIFELIRGM